MDDPDPITRLPLLDDAGCAAVLERVDALRPHWLQRDPELPFHTLGASSYMDVLDGPQRYRELAAELNPLLDQAFGELFERVLGSLRGQVGEDFELAPETARPGFHIFEYHPQFEHPVAAVHFDRQFEDIPWAAPEDMDFDRPLSFTLPIELPHNGGGLNTWPSRWDDWPDDGPPFPELVARALPLTYVPYAPGVLMLHSGHLLHQIAPAPGMQAGDRRITLQGHAIPRRGVYQVYW